MEWKQQENIVKIYHIKWKFPFLYAIACREFRKKKKKKNLQPAKNVN